MEPLVEDMVLTGMALYLLKDQIKAIIIVENIYTESID